VQIGVRAIAWGTLAVAFSALVNAHGHKIFSRKLVKDVSIRMVRAEIVQGITAQPTYQ